MEAKDAVELVRGFCQAVDETHVDSGDGTCKECGMPLPCMQVTLVLALRTIVANYYDTIAKKPKGP